MYKFFSLFGTSEQSASIRVNFWTFFFLLNSDFFQKFYQLCEWVAWKLKSVSLIYKKSQTLLTDIPQYIMHLYLHFVNGMGIVALPFKFCTILFGMSILLNISKFVGFVNKTDFYLEIVYVVSASLSLSLSLSLTHI